MRIVLIANSATVRDRLPYRPKPCHSKSGERDSTSLRPPEAAFTLGLLDLEAAMLDVRPFAAIRYDARRLGGDLSKLVAPPYDVLDESDRAELLSREEHNIVAIDLPHVPPKSAGPPEVYERSAKLLERWLSERVLVREAKPALYIYHQTFEHEGRKYTRKKFIARLRLASFSEGVILPHERTFGGPKEDRLALMKATRCNLSPIFGLYSDPQNEVAASFSGEIARPPDFCAQLDDVEK
jgi:uncharacterized protein (DUF1015 family)